MLLALLACSLAMVTFLTALACVLIAQRQRCASAAPALRQTLKAKLVASS